MGESAPEERLLSGYSGRIFVLLGVGFVTIKLGQRLPPALMPVIIEDLSMTTVQAGIALSLLGFLQAAFQYPSGRLSDQLSRTTVIAASLVLAIVGIAVIALSVNVLLFLVGIAIFGAAFGLFGPADRAFVSDLFVARRGRALGVHSAGSDVAGVIAAGVAVVIVAVLPWQAGFVLALPVLALVLVGLLRWSREPVALGRVTLGIRETSARLFGQSRFRWLVLAYALVVLAVRGAMEFLPTFLVATQGFSFGLASGAFGLMFAVGLAVRPVTGTLGDAFSKPGIAAVSVLLGGLGIAALVVAPSPLLGLAGVVLFGVGQRGFTPPLQAYLMDSFPDDSMGGDFGATRMVYLGIGSFGPAFVGVVADATSFRAAYLVLAAVLLVAAGIVIVLARTE